jgi:hypothetical protein
VFIDKPETVIGLVISTGSNAIKDPYVEPPSVERAYLWLVIAEPLSAPRVNEIAAEVVDATALKDVGASGGAIVIVIQLVPSHT